ncbi:MAG: hypothetical protein KJ062_03685 [Thermoanaerobaculia bacterium]|nr:hypothetical protein [Thermoanaerobaculia bacterium]
MRRWPLLLLLCSLPGTAQTVSISAPSLFIAPNEGRNPAGQIEGIEGGAFTARATDVGAIFYNPAGLGLSEKSSVSAASAAYEWTFYSGEVGEIADTGSRLSNNGRLFGFVIGGDVLGNEKLSLGLAFPTPVSWKPTLQLSGIVGTGYSGAGMVYSTDGSYTDVLPTIAAGYALRPGLRVGGSVGLSFLTLSNNQAGAIQGLIPSGAALAQRTFRADGTSYDLLLTGGLQWDVSRAVTVGLVVTAPGLGLGGSTSLIVEETTATAGGYRTAWFRDAEADFRVKHPTRVSLGLAWRFGRGVVEANVKYFAGISRYEMFSSEVSGVWTDVSPGESRAGAAVFAPTYDERDAVANVAIGGRYDLTKKTSLHLGFFTSQSPVGDESVFSVVDLYGVSTGVSLNWTHLSGSIGVVYEWGDQGIALSPSTNLPAVNGELGISSFHLLWGLTYKF